MGAWGPEHAQHCQALVLTRFVVEALSVEEALLNALGSLMEPKNPPGRESETFNLHSTDSRPLRGVHETLSSSSELVFVSTFPSRAAG